MASLMETWNDTPGSAILKRRQFEETPPFNFLMFQQGMFSGKNIGDLDSVPGYYGATLDVRTPQNARAIQNIRKARAVHNFEKHGVLSTPFEKRLEAYRMSARAPKIRQQLVGPARGNAFKFSGQRGAQYSDPQIIKKLGYDKSGIAVHDLPHFRRLALPSSKLQPPKPPKRNNDKEDAPPER